MGNRFASGKNAIADCDICGFQYKLRDLKPVIIKTKNVNILACPECWDPDHPQLLLGMFPVEDPQALENPRPDASYFNVGNDGAGGSRVFQWGWNPVGGSAHFDRVLTPNALIANSFTNGIVITNTLNPIPPTSGFDIITENGDFWVTETGANVVWQ